MVTPSDSNSAPGSPPIRTRPIGSVSVLIPTYQGAEFLERLLEALASQSGAPPFDVLAVDSGSTDGTLEILAAAAGYFPAPLVVESIHSAEFDHGDTRNRLAGSSAGDLLVFLTQDAIPVGPDWLRRLVANFEDRQVGAAYCRNAPRPDARPATQVLSAEDPGYSTERRVVELPADWRDLDVHERRVLYNFNDVASAIPRELWERHPFPRTSFGEDVLMARALLHGGFKIVYDAEAVVEHSHDYDPRETLSRARIDGRFNAEWLDRICIGSKKDIEHLCRRFEAPDARAVEEFVADPDQRPAVLREVAQRRRAGFAGLFEGGVSPRRFGATRMLAGEPMHVLLCVHGFPPDTLAGTEVYTLELARALQARGHRCTILTRSPGAEGEEEFSVHTTEFEGLRVLRLVHRLEHKSLEESWSKPAVEEAFRSVLLDVQPDLVHFQHLIHLSIGCVAIARDAGLATVLHCHDYWALCARVQLIRPDGERCESSMGAGCLLCVKDRDLDQIPRARRLGSFARPLLERFAGRAHRAPEGSSVRRRWEGLLDIVDRPRAVLGAYADADLLVSPSRFLREKLLSSGAFDADRFVFSDNGLRTDGLAALKKRPDPRGRLRVAFIGTLAWYKGGETLIRAMQRLGAERIVLDVYGAFDPEADEHHAELQRLAGDNVSFRGRFDNSKLSEVYTEIDVLVVPSIWFENSPITIHEAYLAGTPVVASDLGGMAEYVRDGVDGLLFEPGSDEDLARVLLRLLREPGLIDELSRDFMDVKSIEDNAIETEYRYRALLARQAERAALPLLDARGNATDRQSGPAETQGTDLLLMRPGSSAEYHFHSLQERDVQVQVELLALGGETGLELGGRVLLGSEVLGEIEPFVAEGTDLTPKLTYTGRVHPGDAVLTVEPRLSETGPDYHLRVVSVRVAEPESGL